MWFSYPTTPAGSVPRMGAAPASAGVGRLQSVAPGAGWLRGALRFRLGGSGAGQLRRLGGSGESGGGWRYTVDSLMAMSDLDTVRQVQQDVRQDPSLDGDHERMAHIVLEGWKPDEGDFVSAGPSVVEGLVNGTAVKALCGKVWVPSRDPKRYPVCPTCKEIAESMGWRVPSS